MGNMLSLPLLSLKKSAVVLRRVGWGVGGGGRFNRERRR